MYAIAYSSCMTVVYIYQDLILAQHHFSQYLVIRENVKSAGMLKDKQKFFTARCIVLVLRDRAV